MRFTPLQLGTFTLRGELLSSMIPKHVSVYVGNFEIRTIYVLYILYINVSYFHIEISSILTCDGFGEDDAVIHPHLLGLFCYLSLSYEPKSKSIKS